MLLLHHGITSALAAPGYMSVTIAVLPSAQGAEPAALRFLGSHITRADSETSIGSDAPLMGTSPVRSSAPVLADIHTSSSHHSALQGKEWCICLKLNCLYCPAM